MWVPLTASAKLSVAGWGPWLMIVTLHIQYYLSSKRNIDKKEERSEKKRDLNKSFWSREEVRVRYTSPSSCSVERQLSNWWKGSLSVAVCTLRSLPGQPRQCANYCQLCLRCGQLSTWNKGESLENTDANMNNRYITVLLGQSGSKNKMILFINCGLSTKKLHVDDKLHGVFYRVSSLLLNWVFSLKAQVQSMFSRRPPWRKTNYGGLGGRSWTYTWVIRYQLATRRAMSLIWWSTFRMSHAEGEKSFGYYDFARTQLITRKPRSRAERRENSHNSCSTKNHYNAL